jgi:hypothetical protein
MNNYKKLYYKTKNLLKVAVNNRKYSFEGDQPSNRCPDRFAIRWLVLVESTIQFRDGNSGTGIGYLSCTRSDRAGYGYNFLPVGSTRVGTIYLCIKFIGVGWYRSYILINLPDYP